VVGAGPAGSTCAGLLSQAGLTVLLLDRDEFPRDKPCAGWITPSVLESLKIDPQLYRKDRLLQDIRAFRTGVIYGRERVTDYGQTVSYGIRRAEFDQFLLLRNTAPTRLGEPVAALERVAGGWLVNGSIKTKLLIGAGGHNCPVARALGALPGKEAAIVALVAEFQPGAAQLANPLFPAGTVALSFTRDLNGYGWLLRKGNFLNIGLGSLERRDLRRQTAQFCQHLKNRGYLDEEVTERFKGHAYLPYRKNGGRRIVADRALLIGDAAGVCFPESGEGILPAVETALMAVRTVVGASGDYRQQRLAPYAAAVATRFCSAGDAGGGFTLPAGVKRLGGAALLSCGWLTRHLVLDRWFLHKGQRILEL